MLSMFDFQTWRIGVCFAKNRGDSHWDHESWQLDYSFIRQQRRSAIFEFIPCTREGPVKDGFTL
jgi:hypothetical protein